MTATFDNLARCAYAIEVKEVGRASLFTPASSDILIGQTTEPLARDPSGAR